MNWGPIYYRGGLDETARVIIIGQDPAADENVARRILVGAAGQRVQGFLLKFDLTKSYVIVNTYIYGLKGQIDAEAKQIAFGSGAHQVVDLWPGSSNPFIANPLRPSSPIQIAWQSLAADG